MIEKIQLLTDINGGFPPFMSIINTDFSFSRWASDGAYCQKINGEKTLIFSIRGVTATICRLSKTADTAELSSFLDFLGIKNVLSDFFFEEISFEERAVLKAKPMHCDFVDASFVTSSSRLGDYKNIFQLLCPDGSFENWYSLFSAKVNNSFAFGVYMMFGDVPVSCAIAPFIFEKNSVVAGVFTNEAYRKKGYATNCIKALLNYLYNRNIENVYLWCEDKNIRLYENTGFSLHGKIYIKKEE